MLEVSLNGQVKRKIQVDDRDLTNPQESFKISQNRKGGSDVTFADSVVALGQTIPLARGHILTSKTTGTVVRLTEHNDTGKSVGSPEVTATGYLPLAFDSTSCRVWIDGRMVPDSRFYQFRLHLKSRNNAGRAANECP